MSLLFKMNFHWNSSFLLHYHIIIKILWIIFMFQMSSVMSEVIYRVDPLALLSGTLRTYQKAGCDTQQVSLSCPRGTSISIEIAQYGNSDGDNGELDLCPFSTSSDDSIIEAMHAGAEIEVKPPENCLPYALQYSLLQNVVEACQKKTHCKFMVSPKDFGGDPCPHRRKFVEVAYKCRPSEFRSKVACENDVIQLECNPYSRIAIYSASFGRTEYESIQCSQPQGVKEETCLVSYATEEVMKQCHGRRRCTIAADSEIFGNQCRPESRVYLKIVYTCVPRKVLKDPIDGPEPITEPDEPQIIDSDQDQDQLYDEDQFYRESEAITPEPKLHRELGSYSNNNNNGMSPSSTIDPSNGGINTQLRARESNQLEGPSDDNNNNNCVDDDDVKPIGFIAEWINAYIFLSQNQEKFYLYLIISVTAGVFLCLLLVIGRLFIQRRRLRKKDSKLPSSNTGDSTLPNGFSDDISEIDADIDLTTPLPVPSVSRNENYGSYAPSPSPYGNLGPSNVSHASTTMLVPAANTIMRGQSPTIGPTNTMMYTQSNPHQSGTIMNPQHYHQQSGSFMGGGGGGGGGSSVLGAGGISQHHGGGSGNGHPHSGLYSLSNTLRRSPRGEYECTPPRILSKIDPDQQQYYYG